MPPASVKSAPAAASASEQNVEHFVTEAQQMNARRRKEINEKHGDLIESLTTHSPGTAWYVVGIVALQIAITAALSRYDASWWIIVPISWVVGAVADHALWTLIHELTHCAVFKSGFWNLFFHLVANLPIVFPSAISFKYFHGLHHSHLNEAYEDPDVPGPLESKIFGTTTIGKTVWLAFFFLIQSVRTLRHPPKFGHLTPWLVANWVLQLSFNAAIFYFFGVKGLSYMLLSSAFAIGLHPLGARWIAEHYSVAPPQETYSYYGAFNYVMFNIGYHNEHHDFPSIPWDRLPELRAKLPQYYEPLVVHSSYWKLFFQFLCSSRFTLETRVVRAPRAPDWKKHDKHDDPSAAEDITSDGPSIFEGSVKKSQ